VIFFFFFFSSRRRHTRWPRDWSSDVCSSDLWSMFAEKSQRPKVRCENRYPPRADKLLRVVRHDCRSPEERRDRAQSDRKETSGRSEERRVGKERRSR